MRFDLPALVREVLAEVRFPPQAKGLDGPTIASDLPPLRTGLRQGCRVLTNPRATRLFTLEGGRGHAARAGPPGDVRLRPSIRNGRADRSSRCSEQADGTMTRRFGGSGWGFRSALRSSGGMKGRIGVERAGRGRLWVELLPLPASAASSLLAAVPVHRVVAIRLAVRREDTGPAHSEPSERPG